MDITLIIKVAGVGLLVSAAYQVLARSGRDEQAMLVSLAGVIIVLFMLIGEISRLFDSVRQTFGFCYRYLRCSNIGTCVLRCNKEHKT